MKRFIWLFAVIALLLFLLFIPKQILYPESKSVQWIMFGLIFLLLPFLVYNLVFTFNKHTPWKAGIAGMAVLVTLPSFMFWHDYNKEQELKKYGKVTFGLVVHKKYSKGWLIKCKYQAANSTLETYYEPDKENIIKEGDTLKILYSSNFPRMYNLLGKYKKSRRIKIVIGGK